MNERATSETLGYVLVFAIVTTSIGVVYSAGLTGLDDARQAEQVTNMERAFDVLADNLEDLFIREAPSRATELRLAGGTIGSEGPVTVQLDITDTGNASNNASFVMSPKPLVYRNGDTEILYSGGAVFRTDRGQSAMLYEPRWITGSERSVIPFILTHPSSENASVSGRTTILVVAQREGNSVRGPFEANTGTGRVNVTVSSPRAEAWGRYFAEEGYTPIDTDASDSTVTYQFTTDVLYVVQTGIELSVED